MFRLNKKQKENEKKGIDGVDVTKVVLKLIKYHGAKLPATTSSSFDGPGLRSSNEDDEM